MEFREGFNWIVGTLGTIAGLIGFAKLVEIRVLRKYAIQDKNSAIHETNQGKQIEFDQYAFQKFAERLEKLELEQKEMQKELNSQMVKNATLETENKYLKETNIRQESEISHLREDKNKQAAQIVSLESSLKTATEKIEKLECDLKMLIEQKQA